MSSSGCWIPASAKQWLRPEASCEIPADTRVHSITIDTVFELTPAAATKC